jgi:hypothetical protein
MPHTYESDPFRILRAALSDMAESALYMETEHEHGPANPCPDYIAHLREAIHAIGDAQSFEDLARVPWVESRAIIALDAGV